MINNRQAGRRRGRGGQQQRPQGNSGRQDNGNRIDNRARGNAAQLLEKYKTLARDAQMQGDRVNTEYYLQFADHYFRVLAETRSRFEENRRQNGGAAFEEDEQEYDEDGEPIVREQNARDSRQGNGNGQDRGQDRGNEGQSGNQQTGQYDDERPRSRNGNGDRNGNGYGDAGNGRYAREDRAERNDRNGNAREDRGDRNGNAREERNERNANDRNGNERGDRTVGRGEDRGNRAASVQVDEDRAPVRQEAPREEVAPVAEAEVVARPRRGRPPRRPVEDEAPAMFEAGLLPPSLSISAVSTEEPEEKPKRRRGRPPASETTTVG
ncbi:MAG: DUF4167 domain-containing protein [Candidatus Sphingomonas phytovorans]|nr:DUF4167 domain-containing protein [Sphingomonas sp.]WEJ99356.1 MAG: DUF4167 domain-containing protein [Sphingomonas sp.]